MKFNLEISALFRSIFVKNQPVNFDFQKKKFCQEERSFNLCLYESFPLVL